MNFPKPHVSLNVSNVSNSVDFYEKFFACSASKKKPGYAKFDLEKPGLNLSLVEVPPTGINVNHFGIQVESSEAVQKERARLAELHILSRIEDETTCCYAVQDKAWAVDPDGNEWEIFVVKSDADSMHDTKDSMSSCCAASATESKCC